MKVKITAPNGVTIELDDANAEDVERIAAIVQRDIKPEIKELAPVPTWPMDPRINFPFAPPDRIPSPFWVDPTSVPWAPQITWTVMSDSAEVPS